MFNGLGREKYSLPGGKKFLGAVVGLSGALLAMVVTNLCLARRAERKNPAIGKFITVQGVRLHYLESGTGIPVVMLHGTASMLQDLQCSGIIESAAKKYRVIAFDRPGYGYSERPRTRIWTPQAQAELLAAALEQIGVTKAVILGHSWGAMVAIALAKTFPERVGALLLISGYYYPSFRSDSIMGAIGAAPVVGDILSYTVLPLITDLYWNHMLRKTFAPNPVPARFLRDFPKQLAVRPAQIRTSAAEGALLTSGAKDIRQAYRTLRMPVSVMAGSEDALIDPEQSTRLHSEIVSSSLEMVPGAGHMVHQMAPERVLAEIQNLCRHFRS